MNLKRRSLLALTGSLAAASLTRLVYAQTPTKLRYGMAPDENSALAAYAVAKGFFAKSGLDVSLTVLNSGGAVTPGLIGGTLDFGVTNSGSMAQAHLRGVPLQLMTCGSLYSSASPSAYLVALKTGPIKTAKDLRGRTVAVSSLHEFAHCSVLNWIDRNGGDSKSVNFIEMPMASTIAALQTGHIDAIDLIEPLYTCNKNDLTSLGNPFAAVADGKPVQIFGTVVTKTFADANPDVIKRAVVAMRAAAHWANDARNHSEAAAIISGYTKVDAAAVDAYPRERFAESNDPAYVQPVIDMMAKYDFLSRSFPASELFACSSSARC
jgi:NitT/TauT family transport system substrate-binding protein